MLTPLRPISLCVLLRIGVEPGHAVGVLVLAVNQFQVRVRLLGIDPSGAYLVLNAAGLRERVGEDLEGVAAGDLVGQGTNNLSDGGGEPAEDAVGFLVVLWGLCVSTIYSLFWGDQICPARVGVCLALCSEVGNCTY